MKLTFLGMNGHLGFYKFNNDRHALIIEDEQGTIAQCNVNIPEIPLAEDEILVKNYSENEGMLDLLIREKVVEDTGRRIQSGFITLPVCKILVVPEPEIESESESNLCT